MALPPDYIMLLEAAQECGVDIGNDKAQDIVEVLKRRGSEIVASWQVDESKRHVGPHIDDTGPGIGDDKPVFTAESGEQYQVGQLLGSLPDPRDRSRGMTCGRCHTATGNNNQGHYWSYCKVTGKFEEFHFCCPGDCELFGQNAPAPVGE